MMRDTLWQWGVTRYRGNLLGEAITRAGVVAAKNFKHIHGFDPDPLMNIHSLIRDYAHIPSFDELAARTADLSRRIDAAKAKRRAS